MNRSETNLTMLNKQIAILEAKMRKAKVLLYRCRYERQLEELISQRNQISAENSNYPEAVET